VPAATSTFSAAIQARFTSACSTLRVRKTFAQPSLGEKQLKGWRREKKLNLIGTINPEFKDLAQT
jgi:predicted GIY-YIG superfamily endonuclease